MDSCICDTSLPHIELQNRDTGTDNIDLILRDPENLANFNLDNDNIYNEIIKSTTKNTVGGINYSKPENLQVKGSGFNFYNIINQTIKPKMKNIVDKMISIKHIAYLPLIINIENLQVKGDGFSLYNIINEKLDPLYKCKQILSKFSNSKLSLQEKRNLYNNLQATFKNNNNNNLYLLIQSKLNKKGIYDIPNEYINNAIQKKIENTIDNIIIYSNYGAEVDNYNYLESFNFAYHFLKLLLSILQEDIIIRCVGEIICEYQTNNPLLDKIDMSEFDNLENDSSDNN
jgi:hypothetical protein